MSFQPSLLHQFFPLSISIHMCCYLSHFKNHCFLSPFFNCHSTVLYFHKRVAETYHLQFLSSISPLNPFSSDIHRTSKTWRTPWALPCQCNGQLSVLILLDISEASVTVHHSLFLIPFLPLNSKLPSLLPPHCMVLVSLLCYFVLLSQIYQHWSTRRFSPFFLFSLCSIPIDFTISWI